jgi:GlpG protein
MAWYAAALVELSLDLQPLLRRLNTQGLQCRVTEEKGQQCIWVDHEGKIEQVVERLNAWRSTGFSALAWDEPAAYRETAHGDGAALPSASWNMIWQAGQLLSSYPVTLLLILLGVIGALLVELDKSYEVIALFTMQPIALQGDRLLLASLEYGLELGQWWRLITPVFLHFGVLHIVFNALWVWEFGRRIEGFMGHWVMLGLALLIGVGSNLAQYYWQGPSLFGGLSGLLYGLLGFLIVWQKRRVVPEPLPSPVAIFMLVWLVLCMSGAVNFFVDGSIANAAHVSGLLIGVSLAFLASLKAPQSGTIDAD